MKYALTVRLVQECAQLVLTANIQYTIRPQCCHQIWLHQRDIHPILLITDECTIKALVDCKKRSYINHRCEQISPAIKQYTPNMHFIMT